jgi:16S rRNA (guanine527-N7)-methyltransferase
MAADAEAVRSMTICRRRHERDCVLRPLVGWTQAGRSMTSAAPPIQSLVAGGLAQDALQATLREGVAKLGLELEDLQVTRLLEYLDLLQKWTRVYNLTAVRDPAEMLTHHILDSLSVIAPLSRHIGEQSTWLLDVGSGAGLPGAVIAICCPQVKVECVDSVAKKAAFIQQVAATLKLPNLRGIHSRVENLSGPYDVVTSRAFASLPDFIAGSSKVLSEEGVWLAMKGKRPDDEIAALRLGAEVFHVEQLHVPGLDAERCIVWMKRASR